MKCLILAAGYATRLYPLTENFPKPLLDVAGKPILNWLIEDLEQCGEIDEYIVVSNHKFADIFRVWASGKAVGPNGHARPPVGHARLDRASHPITIIDDGTSTNETRLGAVRDIQLAIDFLANREMPDRVGHDSRLGRDGGIGQDGLLVMAGDNLLDFSLNEFVRYAREKKASCVMRYYEAEEARLCRSGVATLGEGDRLLALTEKPAEPATHWCVPAFYYFTPTDVRLVKEAIESGCGLDAPGSFISWLCQRTEMYAWEMPGRRYDIGNLESYEEVKKTFAALNGKD